jgi:pimeloyl-ACP methyl ester carboxylesterase
LSPTETDRQTAGLDRRGLLLTGAAAVGAGLASKAWAAARTSAPPAMRLLPAQYSWPPMPAQAPVREGLAPLPDVKLWFWDTGGPGEPIVLLHSNTGSGEVWGYQQPVFAAAGYRVIGYSRRGHSRSEAGPKDAPGTGSADLHALMDYLGVNRFHLLGSAAGGFIVPDYALSHPERLLSMTIASSQGGVADPAYRAVSDGLQMEGFRQMPAVFREVGPSYRAANPQGAARWAELEKASAPNGRINQKMANDLTWAAIERIKTPALVMTGSADLILPPSRLPEWARHLQNCETAVISEAGHSAYWEQPVAFNRAVLDFIGRHRGGRARQG